jgi:hypothetical protein
MPNQFCQRVRYLKQIELFKCVKCEPCDFCYCPANSRHEDAEMFRLNQWEDHVQNEESAHDLWKN